MRLKQIAWAIALSLVVAAPALAQSAAPAAPTTTTPMPAMPAMPATPAVPTASAAAKAAKAAVMVNINTATSAELRKLKGIGPTRSAAIIKGRPYKSIDELQSKKVIPSSVFDTIKTQLSV